MATGRDEKKMDTKLTMKDVADWARNRIRTLVTERNSIEYCSMEHRTRANEERINIINAKIEAINELFYIKKPKK
jgi:hypothetical protein